MAGVFPTRRPQGLRPQRHPLANSAPSLDAPPASERLRVLAAATEVFVAEGYAATTTEQLQIQVYPRIFDSHFTGKEDCFLQVVEHLTGRARAAIVASAPIGDPWPCRLAAGLRTLVELIDADPAAARLVLIESQRAGGTVADRFYETVDSVAPFMREGRVSAGGEIPDLFDSVLPGGVASALVAHLGAGGEAPVSGLYGDLLRVILGYYRGSPEVAEFLSRPSWR